VNRDRVAAAAAAAFIASTVLGAVVGVRTTHGTSTWTILAGSGAYAGLRGQGGGVTVISPSETENSVYDGVVRRVLP
jgi:hypothetical protein